MSIGTALVIIAAIAAIYSLRRQRLQGHDFRFRGGPGIEEGPSAREEELLREVKELRERVKVLERIATEDRGARAIADEIESLRNR